MKPLFLALALILSISACSDGGKKEDVTTTESKDEQKETETKSETVDNYSDQIASLLFDEFIQYSFHQLLLRNPEQVLQQGRAQALNLSAPTFTNISADYQKETLALFEVTLLKLKSYDLSAFSSTQLQHYHFYHWWLTDQISLKNYPQFQTTALRALSLNDFFLGLYPVDTLDHANHFLSELAKLPEQYDALLFLVKERKNKGIVEPDVLLGHIVNQLTQLTNLSAADDPINQHFSQALTMFELETEQRQQLIEQAQTLITNNIRPKQVNLKNYLETLLPQAPETIGLSQYPEGEDYYHAILAHHLTSSMTSTEAYQLGEVELARVQLEIDDAFETLGFDNALTLSERFVKLEETALMIEPDEIVATFEGLLREAEINMLNIFGSNSVPELAVVASHQDGYYPAAADGTNLGQFVVDNRFARPYFEMPSLAYHEGLPGHHYQSSITQSLQLPLLRTQPRLNAYVEGWALYVERLAYELGWYNSNERANLGRLQWEALRAARLIADIGVNTKNWTWEEAVSFMSDNTGMSQDSVTDFAARFVVNPAQATAYTTGMLEILALREETQLREGDNFNLADFHQNILDSGPLPITILKEKLSTGSD